MSRRGSRCSQPGSGNPFSAHARTRLGLACLVLGRDLRDGDTPAAPPATSVLVTVDTPCRLRTTAGGQLAARRMRKAHAGPYRFNPLSHVLHQSVVTTNTMRLIQNYWNLTADR